MFAILQLVICESQLQGDAVMGDGEDLLSSLHAERQGPVYAELTVESREAEG